jgi:hypothetical protein
MFFSCQSFSLAIGVAFSQETYTVAENNAFANVIVQIQSGIVERDFIVR